ncbi:MAG: tetratricopeptide repeat protein [Methyloceanibacter sp.]
MSDRDFFREVDEAVRQDRYKALFDKYGIYALVGTALIVAGVAGFKGWTYWQESNAQAAGAEFSNALALEDNGDAAKAQEALSALAEKGPAGYRVLSRFQLALINAQAGDNDKAVAIYDALATDADTDSILKGLATIQAATLRLDTADYAEMERRLKGLIDQGSPWRYSAQELLGLSAYRLNNMLESEKQFSALLADQGTPSNLRERADMMLALIAGAPQALSTTAK